jgi:hypothetical protein
MKLSNLVLGLAAVGLASSALIAGTSEAATLSFASGPISLTSDAFEFEFLPPTKGAYKSALFVSDAAKTVNAQTLFSETTTGDNSPITPVAVVNSSSWAATTGNYILGWSSVAGGSDEIDKGIVYSSDVTPFQFKYDGLSGGWHTFFIEDMITDHNSDYDYNDGKFRVRAVPVPAIVPGIALAAAFFGSKALKRNKKNANESVA